MANQSIDTDRVCTVADQLRKANNNIDIAFQSVERAARTLQGCWNSSAGAKAQTSMYRFVDANSARSTVMQNYVKLLKEVVTANYCSGEESNKYLASQFR